MHAKLTEQAQKHIARLELTLTALPSIPANLLTPSSYLDSDGRIELIYPFAQPLIVEVKDIMGIAGWQTTSETRSDIQPAHWVYFSHSSGVRAAARFCAYHEGSQCRVNLLRPRIDPIYEITCPEAETYD